MRATTFCFAGLPPTIWISAANPADSEPCGDGLGGRGGAMRGVGIEIDELLENLARQSVRRRQRGQQQADRE